MHISRTWKKYKNTLESYDSSLNLYRKSLPLMSPLTRHAFGALYTYIARTFDTPCIRPTLLVWFKNDTFRFCFFIKILDHNINDNGSHIPSEILFLKMAHFYPLSFEDLHPGLLQLSVKWKRWNFQRPSGPIVTFCSILKPTIVHSFIYLLTKCLMMKERHPSINISFLDLWRVFSSNICLKKRNW